MRHLLTIAILMICEIALCQNHKVVDKLTPNIDWYKNNITSDRYEITNANELAGLSALVNGTTGFFSAYDFTGKTVVLANDIDMGAYLDTMSCMHAPIWNPIGVNYSSRFAGTFDGQGFCIKNLVVRSSQSGTLFGYSSGIIKNLIIAGGMIISDYYGAGICSHNSGQVDHCINTASVYCNNYGGGIVGKNYNGGSVTNCINLGYVQGSNFCGGIVGSCAPSTVVTNCVYDIQMCPLKRGCGNIDNKYIKGLATAQIISGQGFQLGGYVFENGMYPKLAISEWTDCLKAALTPIKMGDGQNILMITRDFEIKESEGVEFEVSDERFVKIYGSKCAVAGKSCISLIVKGGGCMRIVNMKIFSNNGALVLGTANYPVKISSYEDLKCFANAVNYCTNYKGFACIDGFKDYNFALVNNVEMPKDDNWIPIGTVSTPFNGIFTGLGYVVSNMKIMSTGKKYCGLFGYNNGVILKILLVGGQVIGSDYTGVVCGYNTGTIEKCLNAVPIRGHYYVGGICGFNNGGHIKQCLNINSVSGANGFVGGLCGGSMGGGIVNSFFDIQMCPGIPLLSQSEGAQVLHSEGLRTDDMLGTKLQGKNALDFDFMYENGMYPRVISSMYHSGAKIACTPISIAKSEHVYHIMSFISLTETPGVKFKCNQGNVLKIAPDKALPLKQGAVILSITNDTISKNIVIKVVNRSLEATGTLANPLMINTYKDLEEFRNAVNFGTHYKGYACIDGFRDVYFKLGNDINCSSHDNQIPIGNSMFPFNGILDGNGKRISNYNCKNASNDNMGFVGYNGGTLKNINLVRSNITGRYYTGGICGYNVGRIEWCFRDSSSVIGNNYSGGICGYDAGEIVNCHNKGSVKCDYYTGGICGSNSGIVDSCSNSGVISGSSCIGGITGSNNAMVTHCKNSSTVSGIDNTGGISGRNSFSSIVKCINNGNINGGDCSGGIVGLNDGVVNNCVNNAKIKGNNAVGGITGKGGTLYYNTNEGTIESVGNNAGGILGISKSTSQIRSCVNKGNVSAQAFVGGICSDNSHGNIIGCISYGIIKASYYVGGVCGYNSGNLGHSIFLGKVEGTSYLGSVCGRNNNGKVEFCVYNREISNVGGIDNADIAGCAGGYVDLIIKSAEIGNIINKDYFIFSKGKDPVVKMEEE